MSAHPPSLLSRCVSALNPFRPGDGADRRRAVRVDGNNASCSLGEILDISATGVRIRCKGFYRPYEGNGVTLQIGPADARSRVTLRGVVCWTSHENGDWFAGVAFGEMSASDTETLGSLLHASGEPSRHLSDAA
jgi:hypothetical protein